MLAITAKARLLKEEVFSAINVCKDIIGTLKNVSDKTDFKKEIGIFALQAPNWRILIDEKNQMVQVVRKICTGEMTPEEALPLFESGLKELYELDKWLQIPKKK